ncbi:MAG: Ig-like domain-containing protein, partial [Paracoccaceae bacterium]
MLKDDRMMSMLTFVVIMVAVGTLVQRADVLERFFGEGAAALELRRDEAIVRANALSSIDVLANDLGLRDDDPGKLIIVTQPGCGRVFVRDGQVQYLPAERCVGSQTFRYAISERSYGQAGEVLVVVRLGEPTQSEVAADAQRDIPAPAPMVPRAAEQRVAGAPAVLAAQPTAGGDAGSAVQPVPAVPRPQAPSIEGLPDTSPGGGGSAAAGVTFDGSGLAPSITAPAGGLAGGPEIAAAPVVPQPDTEAPVTPPGPEAPGPAGAQPASSVAAGAGPATAGDAAAA